MMEADKRKWHVSKEIPVALIISIAASLFLGGIAYQSLKSDQITLANKQNEMADDIKEIRVEQKSVASQMQNSRVPSEQNAWRLNQIDVSLSEIKAKQLESERAATSRESRIQRLENALSATQARVRARDER